MFSVSKTWTRRFIQEKFFKLGILSRSIYCYFKRYKMHDKNRKKFSFMMFLNLATSWCYNFSRNPTVHWSITMVCKISINARFSRMWKDVPKRDICTKTEKDLLKRIIVNCVDETDENDWCTEFLDMDWATAALGRVYVVVSVEWRVWLDENKEETSQKEQRRTKRRRQTRTGWQGITRNK